MGQRRHLHAIQLGHGSAENSLHVAIPVRDIRNGSLVHLVPLSQAPGVSQFFYRFCLVRVKMIITGNQRKGVWEFLEVGGLGVPGRSLRLFSGGGHGGTEV